MRSIKQLVNTDDIITLKFTFALERKDVPDFLTKLRKSPALTTYLYKNALDQIKLLEMVNYMPNTSYITTESLFRKIRKKGYPHKRKRFLEELYHLEAFGLIDFKNLLGRHSVMANPTRIYEITIKK